MQTAAAAWTTHLVNAFDRDVATLIVPDGTRYRCAITGKTISDGEFAQIRAEVIANATTDPTSLAYRMLTESGPNAHKSAPCRTCDAAVRLAWGASPTRRTRGLPASSDFALSSPKPSQRSASSVR